MRTEAIYRLVLMLADRAAQPLWVANSWRRAAERLDAFVANRSEAPRITVHQIDTVRRRHRSLNKLTWDAESFSRWTVSSEDDASTVFESVAISFPASPTAAACPEAYFEVSAPYQATHFGQAILAAVRFGSGLDTAMSRLVEYLGADAEPILVATCCRPFWYRSGRAFVRSLDHMVQEEVIALDCRADPPTLANLNEASALMSRRTRVSVPAWEPLGPPALLSRDSKERNREEWD